MRRAVVLLVGVVGLGGCAMEQFPGPDRPGPPPRPRPPASDTYRAIGTEPGWSLTIGPRTMRYEGDYGKNVVEAPTPDARPTFNGRRYETRQMTVDITRTRSEEHTSELQSLMRISYAVFCLKKKQLSTNIQDETTKYKNAGLHEII